MALQLTRSALTRRRFLQLAGAVGFVTHVTYLPTLVHLDTLERLRATGKAN